jgi:GDP-L-fucose synthase
MNQQAVNDFFAAEKPEYVVLVAAKVGGIEANNTYRAQFIYENLMIEANVIHAAYLHGTKKLLFLGSSCIYPKLAPQPMAEEHLLTGALEPTNEPYAIAKITGIRMCDAYNRQYGTNFISAMPTNMYGPGDNYHPENSHVLPAFIRRMHLAKCLSDDDWDELRRNYSSELHVESGDQITEKTLIEWLEKSGVSRSETADGQQQTALTCWGSGSPLREFLYSDDLAEACVFLLEQVNYEDVAFEDKSGTVQSHLNVGSGMEMSIKELAETVQDVIGFQGAIRWDTDRPDGTPRKLMNSEKLHGLGWAPVIQFRDGISRAYEDFKSRID